MAKQTGVWGIELGQSALKALRCRKSEESGKVIADTFDYIEYPNILSEPDVDADELIKEALGKFLSRNTVKGDKISMSVPGQSGLARFIKLPPVEAKKVPDIVKYEARQQIPFPLEEVIWDYQQMAGGMEEEGFLMESEVGLFAMKREQVFKALEPFQAAGVEVDYIQLAPLALYNFLAYDKMHKLPPPEEYDPDDPPESTVILSLGCDASDLVISNGYKVWQRPIPIGGNHFTRALMKELDLTFAKAEHLKRNATQSSDPKVVFQAMRSVFNELVTECQRSIGFYMNLDRSAKIKRVVAIGNVMKLPGIRTFLQQNLGYEVVRLEKFERLKGAAVVDSPQFKENILTFATSYGLVLQGLDEGKIRTNLLPDEIVQERIVRAKKPWAMAAAAALLLGLSISSVGYWRAWNTVNKSHFGGSEMTAQTQVSEAQRYSNEFTTKVGHLKHNKEIGDRLVKNLERRWYWLELLKAVNLCLPQSQRAIAMNSPAAAEEPAKTEPDIKIQPDAQVEPAAKAEPAKGSAGADEVGAADAKKGGDAEKAPAAKPKGEEEKLAVDSKQWWSNIRGRGDIHITHVEVQPVDDLSQWWTLAQQYSQKVEEGGAADNNNMGMFSGQPGFGEGAMVDPNAAPAAPEPVEGGPTGKGYVIQISGHHFHNPEDQALNLGLEYLKKTFLENLKQPSIVGQDESGQLKKFPVGDLGISHPVIVRASRVAWNFDPIKQKNWFPPGWGLVAGGDPRGGEVAEGKGGGGPFGGSPFGNRNEGAGAGAAAAAAGLKDDDPERVRLPRFDFQIQFAWKETSLKERQRMQRLREEEARRKAEEAAAAEVQFQAQ